MTENDAINMLKDALDGVDASNVPSSDFNDAVLTFICVNMLVKNDFFNAKTIYSALEAEIKTFTDILISLKKSNGKFPSANWDVCQFHTDFLLTQLHTLPQLQPLQLKMVPPLYSQIDFGSIDISSQD